MKHLIFLLLFTSTAYADVSLSIGVGKGIMGPHGTPFERSAAIGYQFDLPVGVFIRPEAGYFLDISGQGLSSFWAAPLLGVKAKSQVGPEMHLAIGPGYLAHPDGMLGGHFQFSLEGGIGLGDQNFFIGVVWKHLSSAGIEMPNLGRDFIAAQIRRRM